ncbi:hypothetical protein ATPR_2197 [Acetobacter tropicalis NBRC 101654]|uniref:Uncharacterized protein n=1 Tax=Acetobacter tropicalis NBRC 101654 TaxID=749388 RepID=F7VFP8_9PROT|nr:hypothetical protein ATPR_2197 [Acetobacter tropicalis NBRC 101654]
MINVTSQFSEKWQKFQGMNVMDVQVQKEISDMCGGLKDQK